MRNILPSRGEPQAKTRDFPNQGAYVQGRQISDYIILTNEMLRFMKEGKSSQSHMAIKVDTSKAYDRVEWAYLLKIM